MSSFWNKVGKETDPYECRSECANCVIKAETKEFLCLVEGLPIYDAHNKYFDKKDYYCPKKIRKRKKGESLK